MASSQPLGFGSVWHVVESGAPLMWNEHQFLFVPVGARLVGSVMNGSCDPVGFGASFLVFFFRLTRGFLMYYSGTASSPCCWANPWATSTAEPPWSPTSPTRRPTTWRRWPRCSWPPASTAWGRRSPRWLLFYSHSMFPADMQDHYRTLIYSPKENNWDFLHLCVIIRPLTPWNPWTKFTLCLFLIFWVNFFSFLLTG